ncbi:MAG: V-type ATP synthase subunit A, partial [Nitrospirota bacterium]|nr:V-type ATP synthase subunit A [Nitrospirota bacterium]
MADAPKNAPTAEVVSVQDDLVSIETTAAKSALIKNEVVYIVPRTSQRTGAREEHLKAEVLRVRGKTAEAQVFESTVGVGVG